MAVKRLNAHISEEMHAWLKVEAEKRGLTMNAIVIFALEFYQMTQNTLPNMGRMLDQLEKEDEK